jgi:SagB-type dehydrogenase family enzyme
MRRFLLFAVTMMTIVGMAMAGDADLIRLPTPHTTGGMPLMEAFKARHSSREFSNKPLPPQLLSDLLWAADGVNRPSSGKRTAPSAKDMREILVYVVMADGSYLFDPDTHSLRRVAKGDLRGRTGTQAFVGEAPLNLVYVADQSRMDTSGENTRLYSAADTGFIAQNVYLLCASAGLATVVRGSVDRVALATALKLAPHQQIILAQTVGYPM